MPRKAPVTPPETAVSPGLRVRWYRRAVSPSGEKRLIEVADLASRAGIPKSRLVRLEQDSYETPESDWEAVCKALNIPRKLLHVPLRKWCEVVRAVGLVSPKLGYTGNEASRWAGPGYRQTAPL